MSETESRQIAQPAAVLGLTFLMVGSTFALPLRLVPDSEIAAMSGTMSAEVANVYACVAWAGWAHFLYAFRGQGGALSRIRDKITGGRIVAYIAVVLIVVAALYAARWALGQALFGAIVWIYFIDHFLKAEKTFEGGRQLPESSLRRWVSSYQPILTFGWLSAVLLNVGDINSRPWLLWTVSLIVGAIVLVFGGWRKLASKNSRGALLSLFFVAEALVWGTYSRYSGPMFLTGVYVFHIAAGSYFHYFGSYFFASARATPRDKTLALIPILVTNFALIGLGCAAAFNESLSWLNPVLGIQWFTLWVGVHLVSSDVFPSIKGWMPRIKSA